MKKNYVNEISEPEITESCYSSTSTQPVKNNNTGNIVVSTEFQENVVKWVKLDDLLQQKSAESRVIKKQKKACETFIVAYLTNIDESSIDIGKGRLEKRDEDVKKSLNINLIKQALTNKLNNETLVNSVLDEMKRLQTTDMKHKTDLKRFKRSKSKYDSSSDDESSDD